MLVVSNVDETMIFVEENLRIAVVELKETYPVGSFLGDVVVEEGGELEASQLKMGRLPRSSFRMRWTRSALLPVTFRFRDRSSSLSRATVRAA